MGRRWSPLQAFGRSSLFVYWIHVEMVYGLISLPLHGALSLSWAWELRAGRLLAADARGRAAPKIGLFGKFNNGSSLRNVRAQPCGSALDVLAPTQYKQQSTDGGLLINVAAIRMQQFGVQFYQASLTAKRHRQARALRGPQLRGAGQPVRACGGRATRNQRSTGTCSSGASPRATRRISATSSDEDRRTRAVLRAVPAGARPSVDSPAPSSSRATRSSSSSRSRADPARHAESA